jgi:hypothetical protein
MAPATVKPGPAMTVARAGQAAVRLEDGRVLILGGRTPYKGVCPMACVEPVTASVEVYDPSTGKFGPNGSLAEPRTDARTLLLDDGRVLVSGGDGDFGTFLGTIELYDPASGTSFVVEPPAGIELPFDPTVALLAEGRVLIAGGSTDQFDTSASDATFVFDPASGAFSNGPLMAEARHGAMATRLDDGRVLILGGSYSAGRYDYSDAELFDPSNALTRSTLLVLQHPPITSTLLSDGRVLITDWGPYDIVGCTTPPVAEVFDPRTQGLTSVGPMNTSPAASVAIRIPDGRVLLFGSLDAGCPAVDTVRAFDPDSGTFQVIATGFPDFGGSSETLLDDGEILIAGGYGGDWGTMSAASRLLKP